jgi:hypothetical protein
VVLRAALLRERHAVRDGAGLNGLHRSASRLIGAVLVFLTATGSAAGCAATTTETVQSAHRESPSGPWTAEFAAAKAEASRYEATVLADDTITESELSDSHARMVRCMRDGGFTLTWSEENTYQVEESGGADLTASVDARLEEVRLSCRERWDHNITYLFTEVRRNPEKQDEAKITVDCLRKSGLVGGSYSERKWRAENDTGRFSFDEYGRAAVQCRLDPLGLWREP